MFSTFVILILCLAKWTHGQSCPSKYLRYTQQHTFCMEPNPRCEVKVRGLHNGKKDINLILDIHNTMRSKVATGEETQAGGLPTASNMMQMVWDAELATLAQKWADNCKFGHDCDECRTVDNFEVGQNVGYYDFSCPGSQCSEDRNGEKPKWKGMIEVFYNEIKDYNKHYIKRNGQPPNGKAVGHFTQVVWANTWRLGCGFVSFLIGDKMRNLFVCNYGPAGNYPNKPIYESGPVCSKCPLNTCCGKKCTGKKVFDGLCKMNKKTEAPEYPVSKEGFLFKCDFSDGNNDCKHTVRGEKAKIKKTLSGKILSVQLNGGQQTEVFFNQGIKAISNYCLLITLRSTPAHAGQAHLNEVKINLSPKGYGVSGMRFKSTRTTYTAFYMDLQDFFNDMTFSIQFSVPPGAPEQILDVKDIQAYNGECRIN